MHSRRLEINTQFVLLPEKSGIERVEEHSPMMEFSWKRPSLRSLRLIWKTSLQMLSRLFPLTRS